MRARWKERFINGWREWGRPLLVVLLVLGSVRSALADWYVVPSGSMKPTILEGDRILVDKLAYDLKVPFAGWRVADWAEPRRGDVVVFSSPADGKRMVKRIVGLPGDRLEMRENRLRVNGEAVVYGPIDEDFIRQIEEGDRPRHRFAAEKLGHRVHPVMSTPQRPARRSFGPLVVPLGQYFVLGDNRDDSFDSRWFGFVPRGSIVGRACGIVLSLDRQRWYWPRWHRFLRGLP